MPSSRALAAVLGAGATRFSPREPVWESNALLCARPGTSAAAGAFPVR